MTSFSTSSKFSSYSAYASSARLKYVYYTGKRKQFSKNIAETQKYPKQRASRTNESVSFASAANEDTTGNEEACRCNRGMNEQTEEQCKEVSIPSKLAIITHNHHTFI